MSELSIILSTAQIRGVSEGTVASFRRPLQPAPSFDEASGRKRWITPDARRKAGAKAEYLADRHGRFNIPPIAMRWQPGDVLWVSEPFLMVGKTVIFKADGKDATGKRWSDYKPEDPDGVHKWKKAMTLKQEQSRFRLRVIKCVSQNLLDCTTGNLIAERGKRTAVSEKDMMNAYLTEWNDRYEKFPAETNPATVRVDFEVLK